MAETISTDGVATKQEPRFQLVEEVVQLRGNGELSLEMLPPEVDGDTIEWISLKLSDPLKKVGIARGILRY